MFYPLFSGSWRCAVYRGAFLAVLLAIAAAAPVTAQGLWGFSAQPEVAALSAVLINAETGEILYAKEPHRRLPPASTTKVLTALVTLENANLGQRVLVSPQAASAPPSRIGLRAGESVRIEDLLYGLMLKSGNDAAETLAEAVGGSVSGFSQLMNAKARQIGAHDSYFMNPHGLPDENHYSSAHDLALIFNRAIQNPRFAEIVGTHSASLHIRNGAEFGGDGRMVPVRNHNRLLTSYAGTIGGKTGYTIKARRCFVGEADRGGVRLIVAVLNSPNSGTLWRDARSLLDYGFARYGMATPPSLDSGPATWMTYRDLDADEMELAEPKPLPVVRVAADTEVTARRSWGDTPERGPTESSITHRQSLLGSADLDQGLTPARQSESAVKVQARSAAAATGRSLEPASVSTASLAVTSEPSTPGVGGRANIRPAVAFSDTPSMSDSQPSARVAEIRWVKPVTGRSSLSDTTAPVRTEKLAVTTGAPVELTLLRRSTAGATPLPTRFSPRGDTMAVREPVATPLTPKPDRIVQPATRPVLKQWPVAGSRSAAPLGPVARPVLDEGSDRLVRSGPSRSVTPPAVVKAASGVKPALPPTQAESVGRAAASPRTLGPVARPVISKPPVGKAPPQGKPKPLGPVARPVLGAVQRSEKPLVLAATVGGKRTSGNLRPQR